RPLPGARHVVLPERLPPVAGDADRPAGFAPRPAPADPRGPLEPAPRSRFRTGRAHRPAPRLGALPSEPAHFRAPDRGRRDLVPSLGASGAGGARARPLVRRKRPVARLGPAAGA